MKKKIAEETDKTKRARTKLVKRLGLMEEKITEKALEKKSDEIHSWISKHATNRVVLKNKSFSLFDSNKNAAKMSPALQKMAESITKD